LRRQDDEESDYVVFLMLEVTRSYF
jgi:hypothetical protein